MLIVAVGLTALLMRYVMGYDGQFTWNAALLYATIISSTDPMAVALIKQLGVSRKLTTIIEGESLLNQGMAIVMFFIV